MAQLTSVPVSVVRVRVARWPLAFAAVGVLVAGCGAAGTASGGSDGSGSGSGVQVLSAAFEATSGAHTARVQVRTQVTAASPGSSFNSSSTADGVLDFANGSQDVTTSLPTGGTVEARVIDGAIYTHLPAGLTTRPGTKPWQKLVLPPGLKGPASLSDPTQILGLLRGAATSVTTLGKENVRGVATTHYKTEVDLTKLQAEVTPSVAPGQPDVYGSLRKLLGRDTMPLEVWVDRQQRAARLQIVVPVLGGLGGRTATAVPAVPGVSPNPGAPATPAPSGSPTQTGTSTTIEEFYDFGVPVTVQAPPADQVQTGPTVVVPGPAAPSPGPPSPPLSAAPPTPSSTGAPVTS